MLTRLGYLLPTREKIMAGEPFARLAGDYSDSPSKANGGLIGPINLAEVSASLQDMISKMKPGDVSTPIRTNRGARA